MPAANGSIVVGCSVRTPLVLEPVDDHVEALRRLESEGVVDAVVFGSWPDEIALDGEAPAHEAVERYETFRRWTAANDVSVRPPFHVRARTSPLSDETPDADVRTEVLPAFYQRVAGFHCAYRP